MHTVSHYANTLIQIPGSKHGSASAAVCDDEIAALSARMYTDELGLTWNIRKISNLLKARLIQSVIGLIVAYIRRRISDCQRRSKLQH